MEKKKWKMVLLNWKCVFKWAWAPNVICYARILKAKHIFRKDATDKRKKWYSNRVRSPRLNFNKLEGHPLNETRTEQQRNFVHFSNLIRYSPHFFLVLCKQSTHIPNEVQKNENSSHRSYASRGVCTRAYFFPGVIAVVVVEVGICLQFCVRATFQL